MFRFCSVSICSGSVQYQYVQVLFSINDIDIALTYHTIAGAPIERATMKHVARLGFIYFLIFNIFMSCRNYYDSY